MMGKKVVIFHCGMIYSGGGERIVLGQMDELKRRGYEVACWVPVLDRERCYPDIIGKYQIRTFLPQLPRWVPYRQAILMLVTSALAPVVAGRFRDVDVIIGENQPGIWMAYCISKILGRKFVGYTCHPNRMVYQRDLTRKDLWKNEPDFLFLSRVLIPYFKPGLKFLDRVSFRAAAKMLVNGWFIGEEVGETYGIEWQGCPSGVKITIHESRIMNQGNANTTRKALVGDLKTLQSDQMFSSWGIRRPYLLFVGRHEVWKRIDLAIAVLKKVREKIPKVELVIPGPETNHTRELKGLTREMELTEAVKFVGEVNQRDLKKLYAGAEVFVFPSTKEDFGIVMLEAMAAGCPVIAWNAGGPKDIVEQGVTGYLAEVGNINEFASYVTRLLKDDKLREKLGVAGREKVKNKFSWEKHGEILEGAMSEVAN